MRVFAPLAGIAVLLALQPLPASAAALRAEARAVIQNGIAVRTAAADTGPRVETANALAMPPRQVVRPCRSGDAASGEQCRFVLLELQ